VRRFDLLRCRNFVAGLGAVIRRCFTRLRILICRCEAATSIAPLTAFVNWLLFFVATLLLHLVPRGLGDLPERLPGLRWGRAIRRGRLRLRGLDFVGHSIAP
jgi:hypothetical protein